MAAATDAVMCQWQIPWPELSSQWTMG